MYYIAHNCHGNFNKIIFSGKLLPSAVTKNVALYGLEEGSIYIYLQIYSTENEISKKGANELIISPSFLQKHNIYMNLGWITEIYDKTIILRTKGKTRNEIQSILKNAYEHVLEFYEKHGERTTGIFFMSHELLYKYPINLKKYLRYINLSSLGNVLTDEIKKKLLEYKNVTIVTNLSQII